jgi:GNAT superfamily N-acetyltransferase
VTDAIIGPGVKTSAWSMNSLGVAQAFRGKGVGRALIEAGEAFVGCGYAVTSCLLNGQQARTDGVPMFGETEHANNVSMKYRSYTTMPTKLWFGKLDMFKHLGYALIGEKRLTGGGPIGAIDVYVLRKGF